MVERFREAFGYVPSTINRLCSGGVVNIRHIGTLANHQRAPISLLCVDQVQLERRKQHVQPEMLP
jgi:hypothetical protein